MLLHSLSLLWAGLKGQYGSIGTYGAVQRIFATLGLLAGPGSLLTDAPFGRFIGGKGWIGPTVDGRLGWMLMEICSPLTFLYCLTVPPSTSPFAFPAPSIEGIISAFRSLPLARAILASLFLIHYANRSIVSELRNPGRGRMHIIIPVLSALFNVMNGGTMGMYISGGTAGKAVYDHGLKQDSSSSFLFVVGLAIMAAGFASNVYHDGILFRLKGEKRREREEKEEAGDKAKSPSDRYAIPQGGLYRYISHPSYISEWIEWSGFTLATLVLAPSPFPPSAFSSPSVMRLPAVLRPFIAWHLQPPALFVLWEIAAMLPRARSGHVWYRKTFGKEWEEKGAKWVVLPGLS